MALVLAASLALVLGSVPVAGSAPAAGTTVVVRVVARDASATLSRRSVTAGTTVRFAVVNRGSVPHGFQIARRRLPLLPPGHSHALVVHFARAGSYRYLVTGRGVARRPTGTFTVSKRPVPSPPPSPVPLADTVRLAQVGTFERPVFVTAPAGDPRVFVVEQKGVIRILEPDGTVLPQPFLDIRDRVHFSSEPGLLSMAFAPDYATSGLVYVVYNGTSGNGDLVLAEYHVSATDPNALDPYTWRTVLTIVKPWENHNGGMLQFGPDGDLYLSVGDGDSGVLDPPGRFAQSRDELLGDILRIDPRGGSPYAVPPDNPFLGLDGVRPEIWAYGLRNPWRFWIDGVTGDMLIGDPGEGAREEIDLVPKGTSGQNFGWPCFEGTVPFDTTASCPGAVPPLIDIPHSPQVCAVIGGVVVRDPRLAALDGHYLYGDYCGGRILATRITGSTAGTSEDLGVDVPHQTSFGVDGLGRVYATSLDGGLYRIDPAPAG